MAEEFFNQSESDLVSKLFAACRTGDMNTFIALAPQVPNFTEIKEEDRTLLYEACLQGELKIAKFLLGKGANPSVKAGKHGSTPMHWAAAGIGSTEMVSALLAHGADACLKDNMGVSPLHLACSNPRIETVALLLEKGADPMEKFEELTPLGTACFYGELEIANFLLANKKFLLAREVFTEIFEIGDFGDKPRSVSWIQFHVAMCELIQAEAANSECKRYLISSLHCHPSQFEENLEIFFLH